MFGIVCHPFDLYSYSHTVHKHAQIKVGDELCKVGSQFEHIYLIMQVNTRQGYAQTGILNISYRIQECANRFLGVAASEQNPQNNYKSELSACT